VSEKASLSMKCSSVAVILIGIPILFLTGVLNPGTYEMDPVLACVAGRLKRLSLNGVIFSTLPGRLGRCSILDGVMTAFVMIELDGCVVEPAGTIAGNDTLFFEKTIVLVSL
jgi:hypothetical protein